MTVQEIKDMGIYDRGLEYWNDTKIKEIHKEAKKYAKKMLKEKPNLYKKGKGL